MGLDAGKMVIYLEELERHGVARAADQGITQVGPILMKYGTRRRRSTYLPRTLSGEIIWCQGYSEPNAGSDLANLQTSAVIDGDAFRRQRPEDLDLVRARVDAHLSAGAHRQARRRSRKASASCWSI